jgi:hypothetical protein
MFQPHQFRLYYNQNNKHEDERKKEKKLRIMNQINKLTKKLNQSNWKETTEQNKTKIVTDG